jgi:hypothetical protein
MLDMDLLYVKYRQQELWHEAAARALTAHVRPTRPRWWARVRDTLTTLCSGGLWQALRRSHACPVPAVVSVSQPRQERTHVW